MAKVKLSKNIRPCTCPHEFQDKLYGPNMRVHNSTKHGEKENQKYRCTVCGSVK